MVFDVILDVKIRGFINVSLLSKVYKLFDDKDNKLLLKSTEPHVIPIFGIDTPFFFEKKILHVNDSFFF